MRRQKRIEWEKGVVATLTGIYCRGHKHPRTGGQGLCSDCQALLLYAHTKLDRCPFGEAKSFCGSCRIHCYEPAKQEKIREVMRYAGPRLLWVSPVDAVLHLLGK